MTSTKHLKLTVLFTAMIVAMLAFTAAAYAAPAMQRVDEGLAERVQSIDPAILESLVEVEQPTIGDGGFDEQGPGDEPEPTDEPGDEPVPNDEPGDEPEPSDEPGDEPEPSDEPGDEPEPADEPTDTPEPSDESTPTTSTPAGGTSGGSLAYTGGNQLLWIAAGLALLAAAAAVFFAGRAKKERAEY